MAGPSPDEVASRPWKDYLLARSYQVTGDRSDPWLSPVETARNFIAVLGAEAAQPYIERFGLPTPEPDPAIWGPVRTPPGIWLGVQTPNER